jgi:hypothetical protein
VVRGEKLDWTRRRNLSTNEHEKEYFIKHDTNNSFEQNMFVEFFLQYLLVWFVEKI